MEIKQLIYRPTGTWWSRLADAVALALENRMLRASEVRQVELWEQFIDLEIR